MLTPAQRATLKTTIQADSAANAFYSIGDLSGLEGYYNALASPDFWVWKSSVTKTELTNVPSVDATTFNWVGVGFITRSAGEQNAWRELFNDAGSINPSLANVRQAFSDIFSGTGNAAANRTHLLASARRKATRLEKLFGVGTGSTAVPAAMGAEGPLSTNELIGL